jgi:Domain of unknown function (DUF4157)
MESRFGQDLSAIRVHADEQASRSAAAVHARAYTVGRHIVMGGGGYQPASTAGRRLLAHELAHAIQQGGRSQGSSDRLSLGDPQAPAEHEADRAAGAVVALTGAFAPTAGPGRAPGGPLEISRRAVSLQRECVEDSNGATHWEYEYDGCSLPAQFALSIGELQLGGASKDNPAGGENTAFALMKPTTSGGVACDRHDECYQSCNTAKDQCDSRMYADMNEICGKASPYVRSKCYSAALLYYQGLKQLPQAQAAFDDRKKAVCSCDPGLLPPSERFPPLELLRTRSGAYLSWLDYQLSLTKFVGYKRFRDQEQYEQYLRGGGQRPRAPTDRPGAQTPKTLHMR